MQKNLKVNGERLWQSLMEMAEIGATPKGGVCRLALTELDRQARDLFVRWCEAAGCTVTVDAIGSIFARRAGSDDSLPPVMTGSHLDSQPTGGKFDGAYGVMAGLEVMRTLNDLGITTKAPVETVVWTNEEGSRFAPAMTASGVFAGKFDPRLRPRPQGRRRDDVRGGAGEDRLQRQGAGRRPAGRRLLRGAHRAGPHPRGGSEDDRRGDGGTGPALV